jgi:hypothetical protein
VSSYYHKFGINDVFYNRLKAHPQNEFFIWDSKVFYNDKTVQPGAFAANVTNVDVGHVSLYEMNVDRSSDDTGFISPYIVKTSNKIKFNNMSDAEFNLLDPGARITSNYMMSASIGREFFSSGLNVPDATLTPAGHTIKHDGAYSGSALKNTFNYYQKNSPYYAYSNSDLSLDKDNDTCCLITIPSIFYGSSIKKGTIDLKFHITGTLVGRLQDIRRNGELIQTGPVGSTGSGSIAGMALYNEGFFYLSGAWALTPEEYVFDATSAPKWIHFGAGAHDGLASGHISALKSRTSASFNIAFSGTNYVPNITMMTHAKKGELNHSNNLTYIKSDQTSSLKPLSGSTSYFERDLTIKNIVSSSYMDPSGSFQKTTYISKIGIYDDDKNLIGIASLAKPVKKTEDRDLTFKLKLDI